MTFFRKGVRYCIIERGRLEPMEQFMGRGNFIVSQKFTTKEEYERVLMYSRIYINVKYYGVEYEGVVMRELGGMVENSFTG